MVHHVMIETGFSSSERDRIARLFADIASQAGVAVMEVYATDFAARTKADSSPVSDADERAEEIILARLAADLPGIPVLAEEMAARDGVGLTRGRTFILVDPVDGTKEFIRRNGAFTVNIALIDDGVPVAGCVFAPARKEMYFGGVTAHGIDDFEAGRAIDMDACRILTTRAYPAEGLTAVTSSSHLDPDTRDFLQRHGITKQTAIGSSLKFCLLARGEADVYPRWGPTMEWDTAAGQAVLEAAGGTVTTALGARFRYGKSEAGFLNGPFIAWGRDPL